MTIEDLRRELQTELQTELQPIKDALLVDRGDTLGKACTVHVKKTATTNQHTSRPKVLCQRIFPFHSSASSYDDRTNRGRRKRTHRVM